MSAKEFEAQDARLLEQDRFDDRANDRHGLLGLIALLGLAIPALLVRNLFPDLNPLFLAGLGAVVYAAYLGVMLATLARQAEREQLAPEAIAVTAKNE